MNQERILKVLVTPHISEKAALAGDASNAFVFKVLPNATKLEIKRAVEQLFKVKVEGVQVSNLKEDSSVTGLARIVGLELKKAYVRLAEGHDIDFALAE